MVTGIPRLHMGHVCNQVLHPSVSSWLASLPAPSIPVLRSTPTCTVYIDLVRHNSSELALGVATPTDSHVPFNLIYLLLIYTYIYKYI